MPTAFRRSTLSGAEANLIAQLGNFACQYDTAYGDPLDPPQKAILIRGIDKEVLPDKDQRILEDRLRMMTAGLSTAHLGAIRVYYEGLVAEAFSRISDDGHVRFMIGGRRFVLYQYMSPLADKSRRGLGECLLVAGTAHTRRS